MPALLCSLRKSGHTLAERSTGEFKNQMMKVNLIVIKSSRMDELARQYELIGLTFEYHKHETGPHHYAASVEGLTFEIYPLPKSRKESDDTNRLGFEVDGLDRIVDELGKSTWKIVSKPKASAWGYTAVLEDVDGRKVELKEKENMIS